MTKRVLIRTETTDTHTDGTSTTITTHREEESSNSGLAEAIMALLLLLFTGLLFITSYRLVSLSTQVQREQRDGIQQTEQQY